VVAIAYTLTIDGELVDEASPEEPVEYLHGAMNIVPGLEMALTGTRPGDRIQVSVPPEQGYGDYDPEEIEWFPRDEFEDDGQLEVGLPLTVEDDDGELYDVVVADLTAEAVALDFNPPLAGKTLAFDVAVVAVREADALEREAGFPHGLEEDPDQAL
jgi:FKBP-type peptidyl-prolyl cis-trans isomerase SlyD